MVTTRNTPQAMKKNTHTENRNETGSSVLIMAATGVAVVLLFCGVDRWNSRPPLGCVPSTPPPCRPLGPRPVRPQVATDGRAVADSVADIDLLFYSCWSDRWSCDPRPCCASVTSLPPRSLPPTPWLLRMGTLMLVLLLLLFFSSECQSNRRSRGFPLGCAPPTPPPHRVLGPRPVRPRLCCARVLLLVLPLLLCSSVVSVGLAKPRPSACLRSVDSTAPPPTGAKASSPPSAPWPPSMGLLLLVIPGVHNSLVVPTESPPDASGHTQRQSRDPIELVDRGAGW